MKPKDISRRKFLASSTIAASGLLANPALAKIINQNKKLKVALVGTGIRGITFWGKQLQRRDPDLSRLSRGALRSARQRVDGA